MFPREVNRRAGLWLLTALVLGGLQVGCQSNNGDKKANTTADSAQMVINNQTTDQQIKAHLDSQSVKSETVIPAATDTTATLPPAKGQAATTAGSDLPPAAAFDQDTTKKYIYLTFDDGPQAGTMNVYHTLKELGVKGTFFMVGLHETFGKKWHDIVDTIRAGYPDILLANHSFTHANGHYMSFYHNHQACFEDFMKAQKSLGVERKYIRLPGNSGWVLSTGIKAHDLVRPVCQLLDSAGYSVFGWDLEWSFKRDPLGPGSVPVQSADKMIRMVENAVSGHHTHKRNAMVLLTHDRMFHRDNYRDSLYKVIHELKTRHPEYVFETVENYPGAKRN
ncbi:Peptidoglycan/xylan/chitin deacetylase, PgdA/CDA1 family [Arachidicoccus rhizosphaerae]|uniref:Peptidoglycan/xylan/chitin deacetylase, PgdA/CDA1 family n=1 Tax=Arachidicoccus rhizosphaerae TaxID=551991 RepID=A0A1H3VHK8_9BACT|nr:polysaccharide deacetylase family protein [Arachidicoccus rhizosphaerae]SDZ73734.1 Peptidoglycan/xylan/chitin deacetylase, PgdA/CDA1 family [Arachidicoccus rhizosphaerae]